MNILGFDIGGTKCAALLGDEKGNLLFREEIASGAYPDVLPQLFAIASRFPRAELAGISCGGPLDERAGLILSPPNLPGWDRVPIVSMVEEKFGIPARLVNDADAGALAEWRYGAGRGASHMAFLTFGTGLGAGLILDGRRYMGAGGMAGEIGHIRLSPFGPVGYGKEGSAEGFASGSGIAQLGRTAAIAAIQGGNPTTYAPNMASLDCISAKSIAIAADAGDEAALSVYHRAGEKLGEALAVMTDLLNLERIVIGGIYPRAEHLLREPMMAALQRESLPASFAALSVLPAALGERIGDLAAISAALERKNGL